MMDCARELATEVVASGDFDRAAMANEVLFRINAQQRDSEQQQQGYAALITSLQVVEPNDIEN
jgi:hypothetical protein